MIIGSLSIIWSHSVTFKDNRSLFSNINYKRSTALLIKRLKDEARMTIIYPDLIYLNWAMQLAGRLNLDGVICLLVERRHLNDLNHCEVTMFQ